MEKKWAKTTAARIQSGELSESVIRALRNVLQNAINRDNSRSATIDDTHAILALVSECKPRVSDEQARKGADWLYSQAFTPRGNVRQTEWARELRESDLQIIRECHASPRFRLVELDECWNRNWLILSPVYRCYGTGGKYFDYMARAWQSGGNSYITNRGQE